MTAPAKPWPTTRLTSPSKPSTAVRKATIALAAGMAVAAGAIAFTVGLPPGLARYLAPPAAPSAAELVQWGALASVRDVAASSALRQAARQGSTAAQRTLGTVLVSYTGADSEALREGQNWLQQAAQANDAKAQLVLGKLLFQGVPGRPRDLAAASPLLSAAVAGGQPGAAYYLGLVYKNGTPAPSPTAPDLPTAARWLRVAATAGVADAQFLLGQMLLNGDGLPASPLEAREWFEKAAEQDHPEANLQLLMARSRGEMGFAPDADATARQYAEAEHSLKHRPPAP